VRIGEIDLYAGALGENLMAVHLAPLVVSHGLARRSGTRFSDADIAAFRTLYDAIVGAGEALHPEVELPIWKGGRAKQSVPCNLLRRFRKYADAILLFIRDFAVPFTNNVAERAVRPPKVKQKISGCFRTVEGADNFCVIRSCLDTLRKQGHGMLEVLQRAFAGNPIRPTA
jgi:transposase